MNFASWYTDTMDIYRVKEVSDGSLTRHERVKAISGVYCRIYSASGGGPSMKQDAADVSESMKIACDNSVDIRAGDELIITRGGRLGYKDQVNRAFAGDPHHYYEPFGAIAPGLAHQEVDLISLERINGSQGSAETGN